MPLIEPNRETLFELIEKCFQSIYLAVCVLESEVLFRMGDRATESAAQWITKLYELCKYKYPEEVQEAYDEILIAQKSSGQERLGALLACNDCVGEVHDRLCAEDFMADDGIEHEEYCDLCNLMIGLYHAILLYKKYLEVFDSSKPLEGRVIAEKQAVRMAKAMKQEHVLLKSLHEVFTDQVFDGSMLNPTVQFEQLQKCIIDDLTILNEKNMGRDFDLVMFLFLLTEVRGIASISFDEASELFQVSFAKGWEREGKKALSIIEEIEVMEQADSSDILINAWPKKAAQTVYHFSINGEGIDLDNISAEQDAIIDELIKALQSYKESKEENESEIKSEPEAVSELFKPFEFNPERLTEVLMDGLVNCGADSGMETEDNESQPAFVHLPELKDLIYEKLTDSKKEEEGDSQQMSNTNTWKIKDISRSCNERWYQLVFKNEQSLFIEDVQGRDLKAFLNKVYDDIVLDDQKYYFAILDKHQKNLLKAAIENHEESIQKPEPEKEEEKSEKSAYDCLLKNVTLTAHFKNDPDKNTGTLAFDINPENRLDLDNLNTWIVVEDAEYKEEKEPESKKEVEAEEEVEEEKAPTIHFNDISRFSLNGCQSDDKDKPEDVMEEFVIWDEGLHCWRYTTKDDFKIARTDHKTLSQDEMVKMLNNWDRLIDEQHDLILAKEEEIANLHRIIDSYKDLKSLMDDHDLITGKEDTSQSGAEPKESVDELKEIIENQECIIADITNEANDFKDQCKTLTNSLLDKDICLKEAIQEKKQLQRLLDGFQKADTSDKDKAAQDSDPIRPDYYKKGGLECIDVMAKYMLEEEMMGFCRGNAFKYIWRAGGKEGNSAEQDYEKARWYLEKLKEF